MKKLFLLAGFVLLISPDLFALKKAEGYFISAKTGKKHEVTFLIPVPLFSSKPDCETMQTEVLYLLDDGKSHRIIKPESVIEVSFTYKNKTTLMRSVYDNLTKRDKGEFVLLEVVIDGPVTLYNYYETHFSSNGFNPAAGMSGGTTAHQYTRMVLQNRGSELVRIRQFFFKKDVGEFFSDCSELVEKVQSGKLQKLEEIVKTYNDTCTETKD